MASPGRQFDQAVDVERLFAIVRELVQELDHASARQAISLSTHLESELGLGSLERVELLLRIEQSFGVRIDEKVLAEADTIQDIADALVTPALSDHFKSHTTVRDRSHNSPHAVAPAPALTSQVKGRAEGLISAQTFADVLRTRGQTASAEAHLIFFDDQGNSPSITFGELLSVAERVATALVHRGVGRGDRVAIMLPTSPEFFFIFAGVLIAGAVPVPIYPPFRADRVAEYAERQSSILANASARLLITFREAERIAKLLKPHIASLKEVVTANVLMESPVANPQNLPISTRPDDLALLQYTSGSTGHPKGVMLTHANLLSNVRGIGDALEIRSDDVGVTWLPLYHDMGLIGAWLMPLYFGLPLVVLSPLAFLSRPVRWLEAFHRYRGTISAAPNFAYELAAAKISEESSRNLDLTSWRAALNGAEPVLPTTLDRFAKRFAACGFRREALLPVYGLAESSLAVTIPVVGAGPEIDRVLRSAFETSGRAVRAPKDGTAHENSVISFVSVGSPLPKHEVRIANGRGEDAGERLEGHLWFRGPSTTHGYYQNAEATEALFPRGIAEGWVNSGDRAYRADGRIFITGRVKDIIIHAGRNLYPHEIEDAVAQVPGVRKGCVVAFGAPDSSTGTSAASAGTFRTGTERLVIAAETRETDASSRDRIAQAIIAEVTAMLGMPPDVVRVISSNTLPKTSSGKLRRDAAKKQFLVGTLGAAERPAWMQIAKLAATSGLQRAQKLMRRAWEILYGLYALSVFVVWLPPTWLLVVLAPSRKAAAQITTGALRFYFALVGWRIRVEGREHLDRTGSRMLVSNHCSYVDVLVLMGALGVDYRFVAKGEVRTMPFIGTFLRKLGHFAFDRSDPHARLRQAREIEEALVHGESVFVFPEGTFTPQPGLRAFHLGAFKTAIAAHRPIVPVALAGTRQLLRDGSWLPRRATVTITICPPIESGPPNGSSADSSDWHEIVRARNLAREAIAEFCGEPRL